MAALPDFYASAGFALAPSRLLSRRKSGAKSRCRETKKSRAKALLFIHVARRLPAQADADPSQRPVAGQAHTAVEVHFFADLMVAMPWKASLRRLPTCSST